MKEFLKKYWPYILGFVLLIAPMILGIVGGTPLMNFFDFIDGLILNIYTNNFLISSILAYSIMLVMMIVLYFKNKRSVGLFRYVGTFTLLNIFMILIYDIAFFVSFAVCRFFNYLDFFKFNRNIDFFTANNFGNFYLVEIAATVLVVLGVKFFKRMNSIEKEVNVNLSEKLDKKKMEKSNLPFFGNLDEYYNDFITGMKDEFSENLDHPTPEELNVYFPEIRIGLEEKKEYLTNIDAKLEEAIKSKLEEEGISNLLSKNSMYDEYVSSEGELDSLIPQNKLASDLKYTLYDYMRKNVASIALYDNLYKDGLSEDKNPDTLNNRLDEVILQKSILNHYNIDVENKYDESIKYFNVFVKLLNNLFYKLENDKSTFLDHGNIAKAYEDFDKTSLIVRNVNILDELVIDSRTMIFSPKGIYSVENVSLDEVCKINISKDEKWTVTYYDGHTEPKNIMIPTKNHIVMEKNHLQKYLSKNGLSLTSEVNFKPLFIIDNENIEIENESNVAVLHEHEYIPYIESCEDEINPSDLETVIKVFVGEQSFAHEYNQVDYVKYFEYIINAYFRYMNELKTISAKLDYIIDVLNKENVMSSAYLNIVKEYKPKYYSYDYAMYLVHQKYYLDDSKEFKGLKLD